MVTGSTRGGKDFHCGKTATVLSILICPSIQHAYSVLVATDKVLNTKFSRPMILNSKVIQNHVLDHDMIEQNEDY